MKRQSRAIPGRTAPELAMFLFCFSILTRFITCEGIYAQPANARAGDVLQFRGKSELVHFDRNGQPKQGDRNRFTLIVHESAWQLIIAGPIAPDKPTVLGDDGTDYYIFAQGSGGTCKMRDVLRRYEDTATVYKTGTRNPVHHGTAVWLLFARGLSMQESLREIPIVLGGNTMNTFLCELKTNSEKNSFGPSLLRLFQKFGPDSQRLLIAELEVLDSVQRSGQAFPSKAEFRLIGNSEGKVNSMYRLSDISFERQDKASLPIKPEITRSTLIVDHRLPSSFEYVSSSWTTPIQARDLLESGSVRRH